ncbi:response regulator receiver modulated diguanylate cyclase [Anaeromyxobacter dehalogenans 2CP-1]|uniref:diguanylate cyclase n=1 Tax=Anaeromyxobacter dehalogenans (strain ATCC BAA-258 / DSM 21875 / 2CP-1) TaxID=455488 RepID=B8JBA8_ANAD2|nr:diguanylate cyclase [Anaeromyxobacter dehalogenans]ACL65735.1 response regulator receiver modulated diguanylate cyclase [Anaeromyxobacter dehalogenans 2CP-1]
MSSVNGHPEGPPSDVPASDALARLADALAAAGGGAPAEIARALRAALPAAVAELADAQRHLAESAARRDALVATAADELRAAARLLEPDGGPARAEQVRRLLELADELDRARSPEAAEGHAAPRRRGERPLLLVADDEPDAREVLSQVLAPEYEVASASDGQEALDLARAEHPDLVLLDIGMPRLDGFEVLQRLRQDPATADIPVIFVSGRGDDAVKVRSLDLGAVDYLQKPFSERELRARVERTLRLVRSQIALRELAQTDALTGLANLRAFRARVDEEVKRARRYRTPLTCVMADMDNLKPINDALGHAAGDRAIAAVAAVIREELRETDFGARYGGDEFVLLLPHTTGEEGHVFAERVCTRLHETVLEVSGERVPLGASFGVACLPDEDGDDGGAEALVRAADAALYVAKRAGRGRVALAATEPHASASAG